MNLEAANLGIGVDVTPSELHRSTSRCISWCISGQILSSFAPGDSPESINYIYLNQFLFSQLLNAFWLAETRCHVIVNNQSASIFCWIFFTSLPPVGGNDLTMLKIFIGSNKLTNYLIIIIIIASFTIRDCLRFVIFANASKFPLLFKHTISVTRLFFSKVVQISGNFLDVFAKRH